MSFLSRVVTCTSQPIRFNPIQSDWHRHRVVTLDIVHYTTGPRQRFQTYLNPESVSENVVLVCAVKRQELGKWQLVSEVVALQ